MYSSRKGLQNARTNLKKSAKPFVGSLLNMVPILKTYLVWDGFKNIICSPDGWGGGLAFNSQEVRFFYKDFLEKHHAVKNGKKSI